MPRNLRPKNTELAFYEGLVFKTASMYVGIVEEDLEDIQQILRVKVWRALCTYDPARSALPVERYVFSCVRNQVKDLIKRRRRNERFIEDLATPVGENRRDSFEFRHLRFDADEAYAAAEDGPPLLPSTLSERERELVGLLYLDFRQTEAAEILDMNRGTLERTVKSIRVKMADWRPSSLTVVTEEEPRTAPAGPPSKPPRPPSAPTAEPPERERPAPDALLLAA